MISLPDDVLVLIMDYVTRKTSNDKWHWLSFIQMRLLNRKFRDWIDSAPMVFTKRVECSFAWMNGIGCCKCIKHLKLYKKYVKSLHYNAKLKHKNCCGQHLLSFPGARLRVDFDYAPDARALPRMNNYKRTGHDILTIHAHERSPKHEYILGDVTFDELCIFIYANHNPWIRIKSTCKFRKICIHGQNHARLTLRIDAMYESETAIIISGESAHYKLCVDAPHNCIACFDSQQTRDRCDVEGACKIQIGIIYLTNWMKSRAQNGSL